MPLTLIKTVHVVWPVYGDMVTPNWVSKVSITVYYAKESAIIRKGNTMARMYRPYMLIKVYVCVFLVIT